MNYELAKKLKEAGFPGVRLCEREDEHLIRECGECVAERTPTLSELIEAVPAERPPEDPENENAAGFALTYLNGTWYATYCLDDGWFDLPKEGDHYGKGSTPEEAVAKLWLKLNKK